MQFALSTRWNAFHHASGEGLVEDILALGIDRLELGYDLTLDLVPGVKSLVADGTVKVDSVHNFCPVPVGAPYAHPELFELASLERRAREGAVVHTENTIRFAAEVNAGTVVTHCGNVDITNVTRKLISLHKKERAFDARYEKLKTKLQVKRDKKVGRHLDALKKSIETLLPVLEETGVCLALETFPSWESIPTESEAEKLIESFDSPCVRYWHDIGHGQIRENLGFISVRRWLDRLGPALAGMHIHDVAPPAHDHLMPPSGAVNFELLAPYVREYRPLLVLEPSPGTPETEIKEALRILENAWGRSGQKRSTTDKPPEDT